MNRSELKGKVQTVLGLISPEDLGITLTHEHFIVDSSNIYYQEPELMSDMAFTRQPASLESLNWICHPTRLS